jgi:hypothetical protein
LDPLDLLTDLVQTHQRKTNELEACEEAVEQQALREQVDTLTEMIELLSQDLLSR